jgi:hypothetical protein
MIRDFVFRTDLFADAERDDADIAGSFDPRHVAPQAAEFFFLFVELANGSFRSKKSGPLRRLSHRQKVMA